MKNKRFTVHIVFYNSEKTEGEIELKDNGQPLLISESIDDVRCLKDLLNCLNDENEKLRSEINMLKTTIGRNEGYIDRLTHTGEWR